MKLLRVPILIFVLGALVVGGACLARVTGLWPAGEPTHARPHQSVP